MGFGGASPRVARGKATASAQVSSSSSRTPTNTLVMLTTSPCTWPVSLGGGLGLSVGGSRVLSGGAKDRDSLRRAREEGTQHPPRPSPLPSPALSPAPGAWLLVLH